MSISTRRTVKRFFAERNSPWNRLHSLSLSLFLIVSTSFSVYLSFSHKSFALLHNCNLSRRSDLLVSEESRRVLSPSSNYSYISALFLLLVESPGRRETKKKEKLGYFSRRLHLLVILLFPRELLSTSIAAFDVRFIQLSLYPLNSRSYLVKLCTLRCSSFLTVLT